jgi:hypothetical protein
MFIFFVRPCFAEFPPRFGPEKVNLVPVDEPRDSSGTPCVDGRLIANQRSTSAISS